MAYGPDELADFARTLAEINTLVAQIPCDALTELVRAVNTPVDMSGMDVMERMERSRNMASWQETMRAFPAYRLEMEPVFTRMRTYLRRASKAAQN